MTISVQTRFIGKSTVHIEARVYDPDTDELTDPTTSIKVTVEDPDGTNVVTAQDMSSSVTGVWNYYYDTAADPVEGWYPGEVVVIDGVGDDAKTSVAAFGFEVEKGI